MPRSTGSCSTSAIGSAASRPSDPLVLCLAGWVEYPFSQTNYAAATAGVVLKPPVIERRATTGRGRSSSRTPAIPPGLPRLMTLDLTGKLAGPKCVLRIRTNMECYYDQAFIAVRDRSAESSLRVATLPGRPRRAGLSRLHPRGLARRPAAAVVRLRLRRSRPAGPVRRQADPLRRRGRAAAARMTTGSAWSGRATRSGSSSTRNPCLRCRRAGRGAMSCGPMGTARTPTRSRRERHGRAAPLARHARVPVRPRRQAARRSEL